MTATEQRVTALKTANVKRIDVARHKRSMRGNAKAVIDALEERPDDLAHIPVVELLAWARTCGLRSATMEKVGRRAVADGVNLLVPLGRASSHTRQWAMDYGLEHVRRRRSDAKVAA
jgi:hypothetical protein